MDKGICTLSLVAVRKTSSDAAEVLTQLLFGESFEIINKDRQWVQIKTDYDHYEGWIDEKQMEAVSHSWLKEAKNHLAVSLELAQTVISRDEKIPVLFGSTLPYFDGMNFKIGKRTFLYNGQAHNPAHNHFDKKQLLQKLANKFINAPYLWGGRSPFGIDCSGLMQVLFKAIGIALPRDAYQQAEQGQSISFNGEASLGDMAFFDNKEGQIAHVGLLLGAGKILHAYGRVRIDKFDHYGIYNEGLRKYTHKLRIIKRIL